MPNQIDYVFLSKREGGSVTRGYVPAPKISKSGVTIATGFDVGQRNEADLKNLGLSADVIAKLRPYLGKTGVDAQGFLEKTPLTITPAQAIEIDKAIKKAAIEKLRLQYSGSAHNKNKVDFFSLPKQAQTVIASVSFQYGNLSASTPKFWSAAASQDWKETVNILRDFGDAYPSRRKLEASMLEEIVK